METLRGRASWAVWGHWGALISSPFSPRPLSKLILPGACQGKGNLTNTVVKRSHPALYPESELSETNPRHPFCRTLSTFPFSEQLLESQWGSGSSPYLCSHKPSFHVTGTSRRLYRPGVFRTCLYTLSSTFILKTSLYFQVNTSTENMSYFIHIWSGSTAFKRSLFFQRTLNIAVLMLNAQPTRRSFLTVIWSNDIIFPNW